jgi:putative ABC transport system ATP-binding protein
MLQMESVSKVYRAGDVETRALRNINLSLEKGEFVAVTGPSGSGKTTLLNIAGLLEGIDGGTYRLDGKDVSRLSDRESSRVRNEKISFIFQNYNLIPDLSVAANIEAPLRYRSFSAAERRQRIESSLAKVGLSTRSRHLPSQLSGGQQQRVAIARALAGSPAVIFADEPTGNLDSQMSQQIMDLLQEINREGCTIVMVTHNDAHIERASRHIHILDGAIVARPALVVAPADGLGGAGAAA